MENFDTVMNTSPCMELIVIETGFFGNYQKTISITMSSIYSYCFITISKLF